MEAELFRMFHKTSMAKQAYKKYSLTPDKTPYSIDDYLHVISQYAKKKLNVIELEDSVGWVPHQFKGQIIRKSDDSVDIIAPPLKSDVVEGVTYCERCFAVIKEATHTLIDVEDQVVDQLSSLAAEIVTAGVEVVLNHQSPIIKSEYLGEVAAMELLLPWEYRDDLIDQLAAGTKTTRDIALKFKVPEKKVIEVLDHRMHVGLGSFRRDWLEALDEHTAMMPVPVICVEPKNIQ